jgi:hypothetical protein
MWTAWLVAVIGGVAAVFMLRFLIALLREGAPSVCYWVTPVGKEEERISLETVTHDYIKDNRPAIHWQTLVAREKFPAPGGRILVRLRIEPPWQSR